MTKSTDIQTDYMVAIGKRIADKRKEKGISQVGLAKKVHVSQSIIAKIEKGERNIQNDLLVDIANVLDTNADFILRGVDTEYINAETDLHLTNDSLNNLRNLLESDWIMKLDNAEEAINFFLSNRDGFNIISQLYAYLFSDCSVIIDDKKKKLQTDSLRIPLNKVGKTTVSYHLSNEDFSDMMLQKIMYNLKQWRNELTDMKTGGNKNGKR